MPVLARTEEVKSPVSATCWRCFAVTCSGFAGYGEKDTNCHGYSKNDQRDQCDGLPERTLNLNDARSGKRR